MKLLIDEMYPPVVAHRLREAGHDALSVLDDPAMRGLDDGSVCDLAVTTGRAVVTENAADFLSVARQLIAMDWPAPALIITSNRTFPRHPRSFIGKTVRALAGFCESHPDDDPQVGTAHWLRPTT